ncbi:LamG domain-containing protein [Candidatus Omnitrophota bacterium]
MKKSILVLAILFVSLSTTDAWAIIGIDSNTVLMLHFNGTDGSTSFIDDSFSGHSVTAHGDAQIDTANKKFGTGAGLLDGVGDYLTVPHSADWDWDRAYMTVDFWVKHTDHSGYELYLVHYEDTLNKWLLFHRDGFGFRFKVKSGGIDMDTPYGGEITDTDWHHIALCKVNNEYRIYLDGTQVIYLDDSDIDTFAGILFIGQSGDDSEYLDGYIDELRISHTARWTSNFTPPTSEYEVIPEPTPLLLLGFSLLGALFKRKP